MVPEPVYSNTTAHHKLSISNCTMTWTYTSPFTGTQSWEHAIHPDTPNGDEYIKKLNRWRRLSLHSLNYMTHFLYWDRLFRKAQGINDKMSVQLRSLAVPLWPTVRIEKKHYKEKDDSPNSSHSIPSRTLPLRNLRLNVTTSLDPYISWTSYQPRIS